jgi:CDP-paratose 2-epimerase
LRVGLPLHRVTGQPQVRCSVVSVAVVTGSAGLIGSEAARAFADLGLSVVGIDNDMRSRFFGAEASTTPNRARLAAELGAAYTHHDIDIRDEAGLRKIFTQYAGQISVIVHTAAQPSHDWAAREPITDFDINARGTLLMLEMAREFSPTAPFIFTSTNKVYGDRPNSLPLVEQDTRWEIDPSHTYTDGIREDMSLDTCLHSVFGASKVAADIMVQEYARYFGLPTVCFRGGTLTGPAHSATELHGFLGYVMRCAMTGQRYSIYGYGGKQVRDAIHSADLVAAFIAFFKAPRPGEVYNIGGGRYSHCSVLEAIALAEEISGEPLDYTYVDENRVGDHIWWVGSNARFAEHYPEWGLQHDVPRIMRAIHDANRGNWTR